jgi:hypothetical protein
MIEIILILIGANITALMLWLIKSHFAFKNKTFRQQTLLQCFDKGIVSRETIIEEMGLDSGTENQRVQNERPEYNITLANVPIPPYIPPIAEEPVETQDNLEQSTVNTSRFELMDLGK